MPPKIKAILSVLVIMLAGLAWIFRSNIGLDASPLLLAVLAAIMVFATWLFPDVKRDAPGR